MVSREGKRARDGGSWSAESRADDVIDRKRGLREIV